MGGTKSATVRVVNIGHTYINNKLFTVSSAILLAVLVRAAVVGVTVLGVEGYKYLTAGKAAVTPTIAEQILEMARKKKEEQETIKVGPEDYDVLDKDENVIYEGGGGSQNNNDNGEEKPAPVEPRPESSGSSSENVPEVPGENDSTIMRNVIPNAQSAIINPKKLTEYALNPEHPVGSNKAKVFESALGYNQFNAYDLIKQIYEKLPNSEAVEGKLDVYGQRYTVDIQVTEPNGNTATVRTGWIIRTGSNIPELTTLFVKD